MTAAVPAGGSVAPAEGRMLPWGRARALANRLPAPLPPQEVPLAGAAGRALAAPVLARAAVPGFDNSAMDGYAVRGGGPWRVTGRILAGCPDPGALRDRTAVEIATGAPVPAGADRVVPYEDADRAGNLVSAPAVGREHIRRRGEDASPGDLLVSAGGPVTPAVMGLAASAGLDTLTVARPPRVRVLLTGDEIVRAGIPGPGQVRDALGPLLPPLLAGFGAEVTGLDLIDDTAGPLTAAMAGAAEEVVIVCGSSSVGPADHLHAALSRLAATVHVDGVACRPGRPQLLAELGGARWAVGLPGNPFAALVAAYTLPQPLIAGLTGRGLPELPSALVSGATRPLPGQTRLVPVRWGAGSAVVVAHDRSGYLGAAALADALAIIEPGWTPTTPTGLIVLR
ncbi:molybdopterin-binding protein [Rugosimonospora acidiphila]|uniref:Molybdopterin molybdenumtransferase n=1 Tax=Rugosimonospora acidiphila TaxID=556531 RepID=A0ABP9S8M9_9ACTN